MRGRVTAVLGLLLSLTANAFAECSLGLVYSGQFRTTAFDVAVADNDLWVATGYGLQVLDRTVDPPALAASVAVEALTRNVRVRNGVAYAGSGNSIVVARRSGNRIEIARRVDAGGTVQALLIDGSTLYAGTSAGLVRFDLADPLNPLKSSTTFATSLPSVTGLALSGATLYVADGDSSVEIFNTTSPTKTGTAQSLPRSIGVAVTGNTLFVSDGLQTDVFAANAGPLKLTTLFSGATSFASHTANVHFIAGQDRRILAIDATIAGNPTQLYQTESPLSGGTVNRINALATAPGKLYAAAGDAGLLTYDTSKFSAPFPLSTYATTGAVQSASASDTAVYTGGAFGLSEFTRGNGSTLTSARSWATGTHLVHQATNDGFLLTSSGGTATYWTTKSTTPASIWTSTFRAPVLNATVSGSRVYALLTDGSFWSATLQTTPATPVAINIGATKQSSMARSGEAFVFAEVTADAKTVVRYYPTADFNSTPKSVTIQGATTTPVAMNGTRAAVFTFKGASVIDFGTGTPSVTEVAGSTEQIATALAISGTRLLQMTSSELVVRQIASGAVEKRYTMPGDALSLAVTENSIALVGTPSALVAIAFTASTQQPSLVPAPLDNSYYRKVLVSGDRVVLLGNSRFDRFTVGASRSLVFEGATAAPGVIDAAISPSGTFTLTGSGTVVAWSPAGQQLASATINEGSDVVPLAIHATSGAVLVSISKGCLSGGCEKKTLVYDPASLVVTGTMTGGIVDVVQNGATAWAITDLPAEIRILDLRDPVRPVVTTSRAAEGNVASIALVGQNVHALGTALFGYRASDLAPAGQQLAGSATAAAIRATGNCVIVSRSTGAQLLDGASWTTTGSLQLPAPVRSIASSGSRIVVLTDYSVEVMSTAAAPEPSRRRPVR